MSVIKKLGQTRIGGKLLGGMVANRVNKEATTIAEHFDKFLSPVIAKTESDRQRVFEIRHQVYCEELKFEPPRPDRLELDDFDLYSAHCLIRHNPTDRFAGCVRVVCPSNEGELLPIQKYCAHAYQENPLKPESFARGKICEISRLAVLAEFRRRKSDKYRGAETGVINEITYSEQELRCFPFISIGLYLAAAGLALEKGIEHAFVMMEPRLARSMALIGIQFEQIGPAIEYHGQRAPYYINQEIFLTSLKPGFKALEVGIQRSILEQLKEPD
ncbi:GNAT family N-acetyltransferase [Hahella sp. CCB-MM4]|uniref:PEP-CTERM/exosortase system-associated acyltransferase n=1 Tax=Hahella sp. (strain CCB-MM4) TaxID=1926491 RepID=UPI000B9C39D2|nr:PEP-CTERM/exosortase system-associated acyltransferase [Hahella sp. CCB-MM4]OZG73412.1 GNAT family N-acetyltransferase [Hahella sp. CCB-MM4]